MKKSEFELILAMMIFGTIGVVRNYIPYSSALVALTRAVIGALSLSVFRLFVKKKTDKTALKRNFFKLCLSGVLLGANWILLFEAYKYTTVSVATVCYYMAPIIIILVSQIFLHEKLTLKNGICAVVALGGMVLVSGIIETGFSGMTGVLFGLGAAVIYAGIVITNKKITDIESSDRTFYQLFISAVAILPYVLLTENFTALEFDTVPVLLTVLLGFVHTGLAYLLYFGGISKIPAQTSAILIYIDPALSIILSVAVLREPISFLTAVGVVLVIGAALVSEVNFKKTSEA